MKVIKIIPARYDSKRLPGKLLLIKNGKTLLQHVYENTQADYVATFDEIIIKEVLEFGGEVIKTSNSLQNGTERVAEAVKKLSLTKDNCSFVVNIQADEVFITSKQIHKLVHEHAHNVVLASTLSIDTNFDITNQNEVKVVVNALNHAMYFSRAAIPGKLHIGVYCFNINFLEALVIKKPLLCMIKENLEQLRVLEYNHKMLVVNLEKIGNFFAINTKKDYERWLGIK